MLVMTNRASRKSDMRFIVVFSLSHYPPRFKSGTREPLCLAARSVGPGSRAVVRFEEIHLRVHPQCSEIPARTYPTAACCRSAFPTSEQSSPRGGDCSRYDVVLQPSF